MRCDAVLARRNDLSLPRYTRFHTVDGNEPPPLLSPHVKNNRICPIKCVGPRDWPCGKRRVGGRKKTKKIRVEILFNRNGGALKYFVSADEVSRGSTRV